MVYLAAVIVRDIAYDELNFADALNALWEAGFIKKYTWQNKYYGHISSRAMHDSASAAHVHASLEMEGNIKQNSRMNPKH